MNLNLYDKIALITGSTEGIGYGIAKALAFENCTVILNSYSQGLVDIAVAQLKEETKNDKISGIVADLSKNDEIDNLCDSAKNIDILINNYGIYYNKDYFALTEDDWLDIFNRNVMAAIKLTKYYLPRLLKNNWGRILLVSSEAATLIPQDMIHYGVTKTALLALVNGLAKLTKGTAVTVNAISPGPTIVNHTRDFLKSYAIARSLNLGDKEIEEAFLAENRPSSLLMRFSYPHEIADMVAFLVSPLSNLINGDNIALNGGIVKTSL